MRAAEERGGGANGEDAHTQDGTVDRRGGPARRSKTGRWTGCSFIVAYEVFERLAYYGVASNLVLYLTKRLREGTVESANSVTNWTGIVWMTPVLGAYIGDVHLGRYKTFVIASIIYLLGMVLLTLSVSLPSLSPPSCGPGVKEEDCNLKATPFQVGFFYFALYIIALGNGGTKPNISSMGADQFDEFEPRERVQKASFFNWWMCSVFTGALFANTVMMYIQDNVGWGTGYSIQTAGLGLALLLFLGGTPFYRHKKKARSSYARLAQVVVAATKKWRVRIPDDPKELHELSIDEYASSGRLRIDSTPTLRFFDKAATKTGPTSSWTLCTVTQVEEAKQIFKMVPILIATFVPSAVFGQVTTLFIKQGTTLDRSIGQNFKMPPASLKAFIQVTLLISLVLYDRVFVPVMRRYTKHPRGITMLQRMGIGLSLFVVVMAAGSLTERRRLSVARERGTVGQHDVVPLSIFILLPQFMLMGVADAFLEAAKLEFFYDQAPEGMKSFGTSYYTTGMGIGYFLSSFLLQTVSTVTKKNGQPGWITNNLNQSHLDYYYALMAVICFVNLVYFLLVAGKYAYNADASEYRKELAMATIDDTASRDNRG
ncbi:hypothetical protein EUGRSUZ_K01436 [Eucalyptus grandis]|uniref:Uncharacterized protein n=2 Tax=Eucalyptus grandis TaxID=71139 RepID=A0ACC3ITY4_EUCGR|nr:hypothetical protein EUGRSUZ_K01436 [Eucalyptus grandis]